MCAPWVGEKKSPRGDWHHVAWRQPPSAKHDHRAFVSIFHTFVHQFLSVYLQTVLNSSCGLLKFPWVRTRLPVAIVLIFLGSITSKPFEKGGLNSIQLYSIQYVFIDACVGTSRQAGAHHPRPQINLLHKSPLWEKDNTKLNRPQLRLKNPAREALKAGFRPLQKPIFHSSVVETMCVPVRQSWGRRFGSEPVAPTTEGLLYGLIPKSRRLARLHLSSYPPCF